jgi:multicomponent K+:H+ antiporter subunit G
VSAAEVPLWAALPAALLLVAGALLTLLGSLGLLRLNGFYARIHAPTMGNTLGAGCVLLASMLVSSALAQRPVLHELLIAVFIVITSPVTTMLLMRAAIYRSRD